MATKTITGSTITGSGHHASARMTNIPVSTKHCIEISKQLRYKSIAFSRKYLKEVSLLQRAVPFKSFVRNMGHKKGMSSGRFPIKAAVQFLHLLKSVEANAQHKGLDTTNLKITKLVANRASIPMTGRRLPGATKRTHLEIEVREHKK